MRRILSISFIILSISLCLNAQQKQIDWNSPVPIDPNYRIGKLDNGLTYFIRKNSEPKQRADFYIAQNVGAILEEDNQNGLAHFLEHMCFNGTKNYPGKMLLNYFESVVVKFGENINAYTDVDQTVYNLSDVPTTREGIVDSALLVLHDWSGFVSLEDNEIDDERGVIREEWRTGRGPEFRMQKELMPIIYKDSKYASRDIIGDINVIDNFDHKLIKEYYQKWYRPDLQSIIIVGDLDIDKVEQKIKQLWMDIPKRQNPTPRPFFNLPDNVDPLIGVATDPEASNTMVNVIIKQPTFPKESRNFGYLRVDLERSLISSMFNARFNELVQKPNPPFVFAGVGVGSLVRTKDAFFIQSVAKNDGAIFGLKSVLREAQRVKQFGFTSTELDRAKSDYLRNLENQLKEKDKKKNEKFVNECVNYFLEGEPIPGIQFEFDFAQSVLPFISIDDINISAKSLITDQNLIVTVTGPKKDDIKMPSVNELNKAINDIKVEKIEAYVDVVSNKPLLDKVPTKGNVVAVTEDKSFSTAEWTLSNGAKVVFKKTDFKADQVLLSGFSQGGSSLADLKTLPSASMASQLVANGGVNGFSSTDLEKMLAGKVVNVRPSISGTAEGFNGSSSPKDFETMLQLVYLYFTQPREDEQTYNSYMERIKAYYENAGADPQMAFQDSLTVMMANHNPRVMPVNVNYLNKVNYKQSIDFYKDRFADASDFTFVFTGNINPDEVKSLIETYIGGLPNLKRIEKPRDNGIRPPKSKVVNHFVKTLQVPKSSIFIAYNGAVEYNLENIVLIDFIKSILTLRYTDEIREKEGASYGVWVDGNVINFPVPSFSVQIAFDTDPKLSDKMIGVVYNEIDSIMTQGPSELNFSKNKEFLLKTYDQNQRENGYWLGVIRAKYEKGIDINSKYLEVLNGLTVSKVKEFARKLFSQGNIIEVVMSPKE